MISSKLERHIIHCTHSVGRHKLESALERMLVVDGGNVQESGPRGPANPDPMIENGPVDGLADVAACILRAPPAHSQGGEHRFEFAPVPGPFQSLRAFQVSEGLGLSGEDLGPIDATRRKAGTETRLRPELAQ